MNSLNLTPLLFLLVSALLPSCRDIDLSTSSFQGEQASLPIMRRLIGTMSFSIWDDVVVSEAGVMLHHDGVCRFIAPSRNDESTRWTPYQVYWVIFGDERDVRNGSSMSGFFGSQDLVVASKITNTDGEPAVGFSYVNPEMYRVIDIKPGEFEQDGSVLTTTMNVMGRKAVIRSETHAANGTCEVSSEVCNGSVDCSVPGMFEKLGNIRVTQTMVGIPRNVTIDADPQIRKL